MKHRVLCPLTALLVLETEHDYVRYKLDRKALADVLSITSNGRVLRMNRSDLHKIAVAAAAPKAQDWQARADRLALPADDDEGGVRKLEIPAPESVASAAEPEQAPESARAEAPVVAKQVQPEERKRHARKVVSKKTIAGAFMNAGAADTRLFGGSGQGAGGTVGGGTKGGGKGFGRRSRALPMRKKMEKKINVRLSAGTLGGSGAGRHGVARVVARKNSAVRRCYEAALRRNPSLGGRIKVMFTVGTAGTVTKVVVAGAQGMFADCIKRKFSRIRGLPLLPEPADFSIPYIFSQGGGAPSRPAIAREVAMSQAERRRLRRERQKLAAQQAALQQQQAALRAEREKIERLERGKRELAELEAGIANSPNVKGRYAKVQALLEAGKRKTAVAEARAWSDEKVGDVLALVALGEAYEAIEEPIQAARAYGSLIDLFPSRADLRRFAGNLLERVGDKGLDLAVDTYLAAVEQRPDHPSGFHNLAMALAARGQYDDALAAIERARTSRSKWRNSAGIDRILNDDERIIKAVKQHASGADKSAIAPSLRFILSWETDANDVDFHIFDSKFDHASYRNRSLPSGGSLYADITTGYGPESFFIADAKTYPYRLLAHYYRMGPMGYGMGRVQVLRHDGKGGLGFESRAFVIMQDRAYVDMGTVTPKSAPVL